MITNSYRKLNSFDLIEYANGEISEVNKDSNDKIIKKEEYREIGEWPQIQGVAWEILLKETEEDIKKNSRIQNNLEKFNSYGVCFSGEIGQKNERKIFIIALPEMGTYKDIEDQGFSSSTWNYLTKDTILRYHLGRNRCRQVFKFAQRGIWLLR
jgi:hypothetical protein